MKNTITISQEQEIQEEIQQATQDWVDALASHDVKRVLATYAKDAILLPTLADNICTTHTDIKAYFDRLIFCKTNCIITESNIRTYGEIATNSGYYQFNLRNEDGSKKLVNSRFTWVFEKIGGEWLIKEHHSSVLPDPAKAIPTNCR